MVNENFYKLSKLKDIGRWYVSRYVENLARNLPANTAILDAGAGEGVYKQLFSHCKYKAIDLAVGDNRWNYSNLDYVAPLHEMPIENDIFDAVLCTQVLEHLEWPRESVKEMYRVLKPGGTLYITVPMAHHEHQTPYDFFRYTSYGLVSICKHAGFHETKIKPFGGFWVRWAYELPAILSIFPSAGLRDKKPNLAGILVLPFRFITLGIVRLIQTVLIGMDRFDNKKNYPLGWACEATK